MMRRGRTPEAESSRHDVPGVVPLLSTEQVGSTPDLGELPG